MRVWFALLTLANVIVANWVVWNLDRHPRRIVLGLSAVALALALLGISLTERGT